MTSRDWIGLLDTDVLIAAHRNYYAPDLCPGFWDCIAHHTAKGRLLIIDRVFREVAHPAELVEWMRRVPQHAHVSTSTSPIVEAYSDVMDWVQSNSQFTQAAKGAFAAKADGWLVAYAMVSGTSVLTNEVFDPNVRREVKLPNVCRQFEVDYQDTYAMLRNLGAQFSWEPPLL